MDARSQDDGKCADDKHIWMCEKCPLTYVEWVEGNGPKTACKNHHVERGWVCTLCKTIFDFMNGK